VKIVALKQVIAVRVHVIGLRMLRTSTHYKGWDRRNKDGYSAKSFKI